MATKLGLYNAALTEIGDRTLASLSENREPRRVLDTIYDDVVTDCLEAGQWNFAIRTVKLEADDDITPVFGQPLVFDKPDDWVRTVALSADAFFSAPLMTYGDEAGIWTADVEPLYVRYISNDGSWGGDVARWPRSFTRLVELSLALRAVERLTQNASKAEMLARAVRQARREALNRDAMNEASPRFAPAGAWTRARIGAGAR